MLDVATFERVLSGIGSPDPQERDEWSEAVTDLVKGLSAEQANQVAAALVRAAITESVPASREAELNALNELTVWHEIDRAAIRGVLSLDESSLGLSEQEAIDDLREYCNLGA